MIGAKVVAKRKGKLKGAILKLIVSHTYKLDEDAASNRDKYTRSVKVSVKVIFIGGG